jgi:hypothetical protein
MVVPLSRGIMFRARAWQGKGNRPDSERAYEHRYGRTERKDEQECRRVAREEDMHDLRGPEC